MHGLLHAARRFFQTRNDLKQGRADGSATPERLAT